jgi:hypothetical protein
MKMSLSQLVLFAFLIFEAVAFAAFTIANDAWCIGVETAVFVSLCFGALAAIFGRGENRAFWSGFTMVAWSYLLFHQVTGQTEEKTGLPLSYLATDWALKGFCDWVEPPMVTPAGERDFDVEKWLRMYTIGQSLSTTLFGFIAGLVLRQLYARRERRNAADNVPKS